MTQGASRNLYSKWNVPPRCTGRKCPKLLWSTLGAVWIWLTGVLPWQAFALGKLRLARNTIIACHVNYVACVRSRRGCAGKSRHWSSDGRSFAASLRDCKHQRHSQTQGVPRCVIVLCGEDCSFAERPAPKHRQKDDPHCRRDDGRNERCRHGPPRAPAGGGVHRSELDEQACSGMTADS